MYRSGQPSQPDSTTKYGPEKSLIVYYGTITPPRSREPPHLENNLLYLKPKYPELACCLLVYVPKTSIILYQSRPAQILDNMLLVVHSVLILFIDLITPLKFWMSTISRL